MIRPAESVKSEKGDDIMTDKALQLFDQGFNCAQSVFAAFAPRFGLGEPSALKIAAAFGGGMSRCGSVCGAVSGALMVLGLSMNCVDKDAREQLYAVSKRFVERFKSEHGSILCAELLGCDISTEEGLKKAREENIFRTVCPEYVKQATQILQEILRL
jgi:C_GCAxxG_C_C family probable redox protein